MSWTPERRARAAEAGRKSMTALNANEAFLCAKRKRSIAAMCKLNSCPAHRAKILLGKLRKALAIHDADTDKSRMVQVGGHTVAVTRYQAVEITKSKIDMLLAMYPELRLTQHHKGN